jgi:DUF4097 and DUF4098 domain-containing protein YvlB
MAQLVSTLTATSVAPFGITPVRSPRVQKLWKGIGCALAVIVLGSFAAQIVGTVAYMKIPATHRVFAKNISFLNVNDASGSVTIVRSDSSSTVVNSSGERGLVAPTNSEQVLNNTLFVRSNCQGFFDNYCDRHFTIHVPSTVHITVDTGQGDILVSGINGAMTLTTGQGDVDIAGSPLSLRVTTGQGSINATALSSASVFAHTGQGNIVLNFTRPPTTVTALTGQGNISVLVPRGPDSYQLNATSDQGNAAKDVPDNSESHRIINASSGQGNIVIRYNHDTVS